VDLGVVLAAAIVVIIGSKYLKSQDLFCIGICLYRLMDMILPIRKRCLVMMHEIDFDSIGPCNQTPCHKELIPKYSARKHLHHCIQSKKDGGGPNPQGITLMSRGGRVKAVGR
jgi:hypothetical protein